MKFEEGSIYFNKIIVLQSLNVNDRKTGAELYDDIISRRAWIDPNLSTELVKVEDKKYLLHYLDKLKQDCLSLGIMPFLHWEMHGFKDGIVTTSNEYVYWEEILNALRDINIASRNNLFISVATCFGGHIQFIIDITQPCPFRGFIGPMGKIYENDLLSSFVPFFNTLLKTNDFEISIKALNAANTSGIIFHHLNSESFFDKVLKANVEEFREERVNFVAVHRWATNLEVRKLFNNFNSYRESIKNEIYETYRQSIEILRDQFLHKKINDNEYNH